MTARLRISGTGMLDLTHQVTLSLQLMRPTLPTFQNINEQTHQTARLEEITSSIFLILTLCHLNTSMPFNNHQLGYPNPRITSRLLINQQNPSPCVLTFSTQTVLLNLLQLHLTPCQQSDKCQVIVHYYIVGGS